MENHDVTSEIDRVFALQQRHKWVAKSSSVDTRKALLLRLRESVLRHADEAARALYADLGKPPKPEGAFAEITNTTDHIDVALAEIDEWVQPTDLGMSSDYPGSMVRLEYEARGVVLVFGPWNFPFQLALQPLIPAIAAGNTAIVKPNEMCPETSKVTAKVIRDAFAEHEVAVFEGGIDVAEALQDKPVDHVFFTGSPAVGKVIMRRAAEHLATVTLELGGKCPAIVDGTTDLDEVAEIVAEGRQYNSGQICLAVDHVWIQEELRDDFITRYEAALRRRFFDADGHFDQSTTSKMVDERNAARVQSYIDDALERGAKLHAGGGRTAEGTFEPAILTDVPLDARVMQEEIFGPVLPVLTFTDLGQVTSHLQAGHKPLAMYVYSGDADFVRRVLRETSSGGVTVNGWASHWGEGQLPFGGVNHSGSGSYHGLFGFRELSHERAIIVHPADAPDGTEWDARLIVPPAPVTTVS